jgi:hypothetical protein
MARIGIGTGAMALLACAAVPAAAMVPPHFQRLNDLRAVTSLPALATALGVPIDRIEAVAPGLYRVTAGRCHVDVRMVVIPGTDTGLSPPRTEPRAGRRICGP